MCLCGGRKNAIDADYLGHDFEHTSYDNSYVKREVKKYRITYECDKCGKISYKTQKKDGTVERHTFK